MLAEDFQVVVGLLVALLVMMLPLVELLGKGLLLQCLVVVLQHLQVAVVVVLLGEQQADLMALCGNIWWQSF